MTSFGPIKYRKAPRYKYLLDERVKGYGPILPKEDIITPMMELYTDGRLVLNPEFPWDGASGPTLDTKSVMTPSLRHDAYCRLHKLGLLTERQRKQADKLLADDMKERGNWFIRARVWYIGVRFESKHHKHGKGKVYTAP